jgi:hypothetical protein
VVHDVTSGGEDEQGDEDNSTNEEDRGGCGAHRRSGSLHEGNRALRNLAGVVVPVRIDEACRQHAARIDWA